jgi:hypothetical protein
MPNAFAPRPPRDWQSVADELKDLLSAEEYASARGQFAMTFNRTVRRHDTPSQDFDLVGPDPHPDLAGPVQRMALLDDYGLRVFLRSR